MATLWIDISELFGHFRAVDYATGVSRVVVELADNLAGGRGRYFTEVVPIYWDPVGGRALRAPTAAMPLHTFFRRYRASLIANGSPDSTRRSWARKRLVLAFPRALRHRLFPADHAVRQFMRNERRAGRLPALAQFARGDCLFLPGSFWLGGYAPKLVRRATQAGAKVAALVHDVLLLSHPEWSRPRDVKQFRIACDAVLPACSAIITNSTSTRDELCRLIALPRALPLIPCRLGDSDIPPTEPIVTPAIAGIVAERFVLFVSSVNKRKNHSLMIDAWVELERRYGARTPLLVLAGAGGPAAAERAGPRVIGLANVNDGEREALYRSAWMTAYPSLGEGYGLPVAEALARGRITMASTCGGLAEVADGLIDVIDPDDSTSVLAAVDRYMNDAARHAAREAEIRARFRPTLWSDTAAQVRSALEVLALA